MSVSAIVVAAGKGTRLKTKVSKALVKIDSVPVVIYCLKALSSHPLVKEIIVVANSFNLQGIKRSIKRYSIGKVKEVVLGGAQRNNSVCNGLKAIGPKAEIILVHDAARPFIDKKTVSSVIKEARNSGAAIVGVPVKATIKGVRCQVLGVRKKYVVSETLDRSGVWEIQTPQVFRRDLLLKAYEKFGDYSATDDSMLVEKLGVKVSVVLGSYNNIKITTPEDLVIAQAIAEKFVTS